MLVVESTLLLNVVGALEVEGGVLQTVGVIFGRPKCAELCLQLSLSQSRARPVWPDWGSHDGLCWSLG